MVFGSINNYNELMNDLLKNINKIHTTILGEKRIINNLSLTNTNPVEYCKSIVKDNNSRIIVKGKNYYIKKDDLIITTNKYSYSIITAHKKRL